MRPLKETWSRESVGRFPRCPVNKSLFAALQQLPYVASQNRTEDDMAANQSKYRSRLPQLSDRLFLTDGGMETTLVFHDKIDLPCFAAFTLMKTDEGAAQTRRYYERYIAMARASGLGFVLESPTWRANPDWAEKLGYSVVELADANRRSITLMAELRDRHETPRTPIVISGNIGPRRDGYNPSPIMNALEAQDYHAEQIAVFRDSAADI